MNTQFSGDIARLNLMPLWERREPMTPGTRCMPAHWRYAEIRPRLIEATQLIAKRDAERRVLVLENPSLRGTTFITQSLYAGLQIILPGEIAASHRHTPSALRFVVEGEGAYSSVGGERIAMHPGDFIVTPSWAWHDHGNLGSGPVVWLDGLDTPFTRFLGATFREDNAEERPAWRASDGALVHRYESAVKNLADFHPAHGYRLRYPDEFSTMAVFLQRLPAGYRGAGYRSTDGVVFVVVEGHGSVHLPDETIGFEPHDVFVVPPWTRRRFEAEEQCVLFSYSDRSAQEVLGFWREEY